MEDLRPSVRDEWQRGWGTVLAAAFGMSCATLYLYSAGAFVGPIEADTGWTRTQIGGGITVITICSTVLSPFVGTAIDRYGARPMALAAIILYPAAFAAISLTGSQVWQWWLSWTLLGLFGFGIGPPTWTKPVTDLFDRSRGLALATTLSGMGLGSLTIPIVASFLIEQFGWRLAFTGLGMIWGGIGLPLVYFLLRDDVGRSTASRNLATQPQRGPPAREMLLSRQFIAMLIAVLFFTFVAMSFVFSIIPILRWQGMSAITAASLASMFGLSAIAGRLFTGFLLDRIDARLVTSIAMGLPMLASLLLWWMPGVQGGAGIAILLMGLSLGAEVDAIAYLISRYFGARNYALLFGTTLSVSSIATGIAPLVSGMIYDRTGGYTLLLLIMIFPCMVSALAIATLGGTPDVHLDPGPQGKSPPDAPIASAHTDIQARY